MIAIFTRTEQDFREMELYPKKNFVRIMDLNDVRGKRFTGVITCYHWHEERKQVEAFEYLRHKHPELF